mgnify:FL=1
MKKILFLMFCLTSIVFASERMLVNVVKNVSIPNVQATITNAKSLQKDLSDENFTKFIKSWKKVEALYFAGDLDENFADTPRYMDVFNNLKEDLNTQMQRVIESKDEPKVALFKNSFKTVNALEYVLYNDKEITPREKAIAIEILNSFISNLEGIKKVYETFLTSKPKDEKMERGLILNTLIASSYKLKEWRIGNASGNSSKFKNDAKNERAEYFLSKNSFAAIDAILEAHKEVLLKSKNYDFATYALEKGAAIELLGIIDNINSMQEELNKLPKDDFTKGNNLFNSAKDIHNAYYVTLVEKLSISAKILDADGD